MNLADRSSALLIDAIDVLREAMRTIQRRHPFQVDAIVVLPDHLHAVWTLPASDAAFPLRWGLIKAAFSRKLPGMEYRSASRQSKGERGIWQRRYWEHEIRDDDDFARHVDYIHFNPVKHGYVTRAADWRHSSIHRYIEDGRLPRDWGGDAGGAGKFGES